MDEMELKRLYLEDYDGFKREAKQNTFQGHLNHRKRKKRDIHVERLRNNCSKRIKTALKKGVYKEYLGLLGCDTNRLIDHLESLWTEGMTWENYGKDGWEMDHIVSCSKFDKTKLEERVKCFHYTNIQPLWAEDNSLKGTKTMEEFLRIKTELKPN